MAAEQPYGRLTPVPVHILPEMVIDFGPPDPSLPSLQLALTLCQSEKPTAEAVNAGLLELYWSVNQLEISAGGAGLSSETDWDEFTSAGKIRLCFAPTDANGAEKRLRQLVEQINQAAALPIPASFERCEARVEPCAA